MVVFDNAVLTLLLWDKAKAPEDPATGKPVEKCRERMELLVEQLHRARETIIIPTPVLSELLVVTGEDGLNYVYILQKVSVFRIESFDSRAAIELAEINRTILDAGEKRAGIKAPWNLIKLDRQIVAIAKVAGAHTIYTNDERLGNFAKRNGFQVIGVHDLPLPPEEKQADLIKILEQQAAFMTGPEHEPTKEEAEASEPDSEADESPNSEG